MKLDRDDQKALLKEGQDATILGSKLTDQLLTFARHRHVDAQVSVRASALLTRVNAARAPKRHQRRCQAQKAGRSSCSSIS
jgi:hypothetical protein